MEKHQKPNLKYVLALYQKKLKIFAKWLLIVVLKKKHTVVFMDYWHNDLRCFFNHLKNVWKNNLWNIMKWFTFFDTNKLRNLSKLFAHQLHTDAISWQVLQVIKLTERDTNSSKRIFIKILFKELAEFLGIKRLSDRLQNSELAIYFQGLFPKDNPKDTRFSINYFTTIGLGYLTEQLRAYHELTKKNLNKGAPKEKSKSSPSSSSSSSSSDSSSD